MVARPWRYAPVIPVGGGLQDYPEELNLVRRIQGPSTRFTRANYIQMVRVEGGRHRCDVGATAFEKCVRGRGGGAPEVEAAMSKDFCSPAVLPVSHFPQVCHW